MRVLFSTHAMSDLTAIGEYIAADNPARALSFVDELIASCLAIAETPYGFPIAPRYERRGIRRRNHGRYAIFYRIESDTIQVLHILHGAQDHGRIPPPDV